MVRQMRTFATLLALTAALSGCMRGAGPMSILSGSGRTPDATSRAALSVTDQQAASPLISDLMARQTVLAPGSAYAQVADAVMATSSGVAQAELRAARMRAVARSKNWLPTIGPTISLNALGDVVAGLLVDLTLYDNGKRKAEREFAAADVEVFAVALSQDVNDRLYDGLTLYITIAEAREKAGITERGLGRMQEFNRVVTERVKGGASSLSDQRVVRSTISEMAHEASTHREAEASARAELAALTDGASLPEMTHAAGVNTPMGGMTALDVLRAEAEAKRAAAEGKAERAAMLPTLSASTILGVGKSRSLDYEGTGLGLGTAAEMDASRAREAAALAEVEQARETAARKRSRLDSQLSALRRQERDAADLVQQTRANYRIFQEQFEAGQKSVMDVLNVYEQMIQNELQHIDLKYQVVQAELEIARMQGALAEGAKI